MFLHDLSRNPYIAFLLFSQNDLTLHLWKYNETINYFDFVSFWLFELSQWGICQSLVSILFIFVVS